MKALGWSLLILLLLHLFAAGGFVAWLGASGRFSQERLETIYETFELTLAQQQAREQEAAELEAQARQVAHKAARLEAVADGPITLRDRLALKEQADAIAIQRVERLQRATSDLRRQIERAKAMLTEQKAQLDAERAAFEAFVAQRTTRMHDEDFQQAVSLYEQLKPDQTKQMFQDLLAQGQIEQVVAYLAAMQLRKSSAVLEQFETDAEIQQATMLVEMLRQRGVPTDTTAKMAEAAQ